MSKKKLSCDTDEAFLEEIKDAVIFLQCGPEPQTSIRSFIEEACRAKLKAIKRKHKSLLPEGGEIPKRKNLRPRQGRRIF